MFTKRFVLMFVLSGLSILLLFTIFSMIQPVSAEQSIYSGNESHRISILEAMGLTKAFRISASSDTVFAHYFGQKAILEALTQTGCVGVRMYYGKHQDGSPALVIIGVDSKGNDMTAGIILQKSIPCPPESPENSVLKDFPHSIAEK